jgi:hypothetical protein
LTENIDWKNDFVIFLGDYFDRFPNEKEVIVLFNELYKLSQQENIIFLKGNHEKYKFVLSDYYKVTNQIKQLTEYLKQLEKKAEQNYQIDFIKIENNINKILQKYIPDININLYNCSFVKRILYKNKKNFSNQIYKKVMKDIRQIEKIKKFFKQYNIQKENIKQKLEKLKKDKESMLKLFNTRKETVLTFEKNKMLRKLLKFEKKLKNFYVFRHNGIIYNFNHGGFVHSLRNDDWIFFNEDDFIEGTGTYGDEFKTAKNFSNMYPQDYLFHGHRDLYINGPYYKGVNNVFNLNGAAERGYDLRLAEIDIKNDKVLNIKRVFSQRKTKFYKSKNLKFEKKIIKILKTI